MASNAMAMGGKKQQDPLLPSGLVNALGANVAAQAVDPSLAFANWCQARLGRLSPDQAQCVTQLSYRFSKAPHRDLWSSPVKVTTNDTVSVTSSGSPRILVGLNETPDMPANGSFVANAEGVLAFSAPAKGKKFSVTEVQVKRCFESSGKNALCAENETTAEDQTRKANRSERRKRPASAGAPRFAS